MAGAAHHLSDDDRAAISAAVEAAESKSSGEIVTIVSDRSDGYFDVALAWSALVAMTALTVLSLLPDFYLGLIDRVLGRWSHEWTPRAVLVLATCAAIAKFLGMLLLQLWRPLRMWLVPRFVSNPRVRARAVTLFRVGAERRTTGRTGILIYLSLAEHRAEIVADEAIASKVSPEVWGEAMAAMLVELRAGRIGAGMAAAVAKVGDVLAQHLPRAEDDKNELPDRVIEV
ncbi:TPM domain-containing protein [Novosphingobium aquiterrae]|uniref:TPM domain-containing protein n=1 Tax=Novosphingobium aquiterrae TaxID=624388 RepID=A0ABV6PEB2_9SPHN